MDSRPAESTLAKKIVPQMVSFSPLIFNLMVYKTAIWRRKENTLCESTLQTINCHIKNKNSYLIDLPNNDDTHTKWKISVIELRLLEHSHLL